MRKTILIFLSTTVLALLVSACGASGPSISPGLISWIDAPLNDSTLPLAPYQIVAHGSAPDTVEALEISVNGEILSVVNNPDPGDLLFTVKLGWTPPSAGEYLIQARSQNSGGQWSDPALARVVVSEDDQPSIALEFNPTETPTPEPISCDPEIRATMNTTCRMGPSTYNDPAVYLLEGESAPVLGRNQDSSWWAVQPDTLEQACWVSGTTATSVCIPEDLEILESPPYITRVFPSNPEIYWGDNPQKTTTIQAQCGGEIPVTNVRFIYHLAGKAQWYNISMVLTSEDVWHVTLDARNIDGYRDIESSIIEYYIEATNQAGLFTKSAILNNLKLKKMP
jgi:hypothetical protein